MISWSKRLLICGSTVALSILLFASLLTSPLLTSPISKDTVNSIQSSFASSSAILDKVSDDSAATESRIGTVKVGIQRWMNSLWQTSLRVKVIVLTVILVTISAVILGIVLYLRFHDQFRTTVPDNVTIEDSKDLSPPAEINDKLAKAKFRSIKMIGVVIFLSVGLNLLISPTATNLGRLLGGIFASLWIGIAVYSAFDHDYYLMASLILALIGVGSFTVLKWNDEYLELVRDGEKLGMFTKRIHRVVSQAPFIDIYGIVGLLFIISAFLICIITDSLYL